ncbi:MAG: hypothetical protein ACREHC_07180 [Candidatus Levyibacteriota bacterium]
MSDVGAETTAPPQEITSLVDKSRYKHMPFQEPAVRSSLGTLCSLSNSIRPEFIDREAWETRREETGLLQPRTDGSKTLLLTKDMQLPEMIEVARTIDYDIFLQDPEKAAEHTDKLEALGKTFRNAGIYIAQRLTDIKEGQTLAASTAQDFYSYGESLRNGFTGDGSTDINKISKQELSEEQTQSVDRWLAGVELYVSRRMAVERRLTYMTTDTPKEVLRQQLLEETRRDSLAQYFRTMDKSLHLRSRTHADSAIPLKENPNKEPWELDESAHETFIRTSQNRIHRVIEAPLAALHSSIMQHGMEQLNKNVGFDRLKDEVDAIRARQENGEELSSDEKDLVHNLMGVITSFERWQESETTLREGLRIDSLKDELTADREKAMQTGNMEAIGEKEEEIVKKIQHAVSAIPYESGRNNPTDIITEQSLNCVGASLLAGTFLSELGINYFVMDQPGHSNILVVRSDDTVYVHDMLHPEAVYSQNEIEEKLNGIKSNGEPITVQDIIVESKHPTGQSLHIRTGYDSLTLHHSDTGHQTQLMFNAAGILTDLGKYYQSVPILRTIVDQDPGNIPALRNLSYGLARMGRREEAISVGKRAVAFDKNSPDALYALVDAYFVAGNEQEVQVTAEHLLKLIKEQNLTEDPAYKYMSNRINSMLNKLQMN